MRGLTAREREELLSLATPSPAEFQILDDDDETEIVLETLVACGRATARDHSFEVIDDGESEEWIRTWSITELGLLALRVAQVQP